MSEIHPRARIWKSLISDDPYPWKLYFTRISGQTPTHWYWYSYSTFEEAVSEANRRIRRPLCNPTSQ